MIWLVYGDTAKSVYSIEEGIEELLKIDNNNVYLEFEGKRLRRKDITKDDSLEEINKKISKITIEEYITDIEQDIERDDTMSSFDIADSIERIPDKRTRLAVMSHFKDYLVGIPYITNKVRYEAKEEAKETLGSRMWIVPENDLEAKTIVEMLQREGENYLVTGQAWGASWEGLEEEIKEQVEKAKEEARTVYGVELQGDSKGAINVDHHIYGEDDRSNPNSSIEQVATILGVELTLDEQFVSANDKGYIPAMEKLGQELGLSEENLQEVISNIRMRDREMQGVTMEQEAQAQEAVEKLGELTEKRDYISMDLPHSKTSTITDRLYGKYDNLLITSADGETNFYGITEIINMLNEKFPGGWSGGQLDQGSGFWGGYADQEAIKSEVQRMVENIRARDDDKRDDVTR